MKILQLIDSLRPGGAERMALNYFLALERMEGQESFLVTTRSEGSLAKNIRKKTNYFFLKKSSWLDLKAFLKLKAIISNNGIDLIQAHGSSWFWAVLCKLTGSKVKIVWHDHYGNSEFLQERKILFLKIFSTFFDGIIAVNNKLLMWCREKLKFNKPSTFLPNFVAIPKTIKNTSLGQSKFNIVCVANLRPQKDHFTLITAFNLLKEEYDITLHLIGGERGDAHSKTLLKRIVGDPFIKYYGEVSTVNKYLSSASIGILASKSEGLPLALLEYGIAGLPVICTDTGECSKVVGDFGILIPPGDAEQLASSIRYYLENPEIAKRDSLNYHRKVMKEFSEDTVIDKFLKFLKEL